MRGLSFITITKLAVQSVLKFPRTAFSLKLQKNRLGALYEIDKHGQYQIFRETVSAGSFPPDQEHVVLVIGFRLKFIGKNSFFHWLFQRVCILTTPFWSGMKGFSVKLWMVEPYTKEYLGIYQWCGNENAVTYVKFLLPILQIFSQRHSIWHEVHEGVVLDQYLQSRIVSKIFTHRGPYEKTSI